MKNLIAFAILAAMAYSAGAATIHVPADQSTIQTALDASSAGDTVLVAPGSYAEILLYPSHRVTVLSSDGPDVTFLGAPPSDQIASFSIPDMALDSDTGAMATDDDYYLITALATDSGSSFEGFTVTGAHGAQRIIYLSNSPYFELTDNRFINNDAYDVIKSYTGPTIISRNLIANSATGNAIISTGPECHFFNNTVYGGERGLAIYGESSTIVNNIVAGVAWYAIWEPDPSTFVNYNNFWNNGENGNPGSHGFSLDPLFVDAFSGDFHLQPVSPCIDAGNPAPEYNDPDGSRNDMGAFTLVSGGPTACIIGFASEDILNVVSHTPVIEWVFYDPSAGTQVAFELEVGTDQDWSVAELWSTGIIYAAETSVIYGGLPLEDGLVYYLRVRVSNGAEWGLWSQRAFRMNSVPSQPLADYPVSQEVVRCSNVFLRVANSSDPEGDSIVYDFEVYADPQLTEPIYNEYGVMEQSDYTTSSILPELEIGAQFWWRARSFDGFESSEWCPTESFMTRAAGVILVPEDQFTIQEAITVADDYDTVLVGPGTYDENIDYCGKQIVIMSSAGPGATIIAGITSKTPVVTLASGEGPGAVLDGFGVRNGYGMGIYCDGSSPVIRNCDINNCINSYTNGGGIFCVYSGATIHDNIIHNNLASVGGGIAGYGSVPLEITNNLIYDNRATHGPGIGFYEPTSNLSVRHNLVFDNYARYPWSNGAVYLDATDSEILNNTVAYNDVTGVTVLHGTGVYVLNNIIVGNRDDGIDAVQSFCDYNDVWDNGTSNTIGPHGISADPLFVSPEYSDFRIWPESPCVDAGDPDPIYSDPDGSRNDIGAMSVWNLLPMATDINMAPEEMTAVISHTPTIGWTFFDTTGSQTAFEIQIGRDNLWSMVEMWSSGEIFTSDNFAVYGGEPLQDGATYYLRLRLQSGAEWGSWTVRPFTMNSAPTPPVPLRPIAQEDTRPQAVYLEVANSTDDQEHTVTYDFEVYDDESLTSLVASQYDVEQQADSTAWGAVPGLEADREYWWRARAHDGYEYSDWSASESFLTTGFEGTTIHVPSEMPTIQSAINAALYLDTVLVAPGIYSESIDFIGKAICVRSSDGRDVTFIEPGGVDVLTDVPMAVDSMSRDLVAATAVNPAIKFIHGEDRESILEGFTVNNPGGHGVYCDSSSPVIRHCDISYCNGGWNDGGGILCVESGALIEYNRIHHNECRKTGAGIGGCGSGPIEISHNVIYDNESAHGPGIGFFAPAANINIHHNVVTNNSGQPDGMGAVYINGTDSRIINNTVVANTNGITIYEEGGTGVEILNNIVASNAGAGIEPSVAYYDYNDAWANYSDNNPGPNGISLDPMFVPGGFTLLEASPCIDAGHPDPIYNDLDGTRNDIGAYYFGQIVQCCLLRGDIDSDGEITPLDIVCFVNWLWRNGAAPPCLEEADFDADGSVDPTDCLHLANYMWRSGPPPAQCP